MQWFESVFITEIRDWLWRHLLFWLFYVIFFTLVTLPYNGSFADCLAIALLWLPFNALFTYILLYGLLPLLLQMRYDWFLCGLIAYLLLALGGNFLFRAFVLIPYQSGIRLPSNNDTRNQIFAVGSFIGTQAIVIIAAGIKLMRHSYRIEQANQQLAHQTHLAELQVLKAQIHPHFLFNTLNNLYLLTLKQSVQAPDIVLKLSGLLNYMLYECNRPAVTLGQEISCILNYIELEKLRYGNRLSITVTVSGDADDQPIAPFLLIPLVENAFKHGSSQQTGRANIGLTVSIVENQLAFRLENSFDASFVPKTYNPVGIGLSNVRKRLQLIYPNAHELLVHSESELFMVELNLDLDRMAVDLQTID